MYLLSLHLILFLLISINIFNFNSIKGKEKNKLNDDSDNMFQSIEANFQHTYILSVIYVYNIYQLFFNMFQLCFYEVFSISFTFDLISYM